MLLAHSQRGVEKHGPALDEFQQRIQVNALLETAVSACASSMSDAMHIHTESVASMIFSHARARVSFTNFLRAHLCAKRRATSFSPWYADFLGIFFCMLLVHISLARIELSDEQYTSTCQSPLDQLLTRPSLYKSAPLKEWCGQEGSAKWSKPVFAKDIC